MSGNGFRTSTCIGVLVQNTNTGGSGVAYRNTNVGIKKVNIQKADDYIGSGLFYASEQEIKRKIAIKNNSYSEQFLLRLHKELSSYDESFLKPIVWIFILLIIFACLYLFTGFHNGDKIVEYNIQFDWSNARQTTTDFLLSILFSLKNIVPFNVSPGYYLSSDKTQSSTQGLELFQRILNFVLLAALTTSLVKYLKK